MISTSRQIELTHRCPHQALTFILQLAKLPYLPDAHIGVAEDWMFGIMFQERARCMSRAAYTRLRIASLDSPKRALLSFS